MKKAHRYLLGALLILISSLFFTAKFDREYLSLPAQEGAITAIKLKAGTTYRQSFFATRRSISQLSISLGPATARPSIDSLIELTVTRENEVLSVQQIRPSLISSASPIQIQFFPPLVTEPGQIISFTLVVPPALAGSYRVQLSPPVEKAQSTNPSFYINDQLQDQSLAFDVFYVFRPPLAYQLGIFLLGLAVFLIVKPFFALKPKIAIAFYVIALSAAFIAPTVYLGHFSPLLLVTFVIGFVSMFLWLRTLKLPLLAVLLGAHAYAFTTYFPLHILSGRDKLLSFAFLPLIFLMFYPASQFFKKHFKVSLLILITIVLFVIFLPYRPAPIKPVHVVSLKDIFLDPNQIPMPGKVNDAYYTWLLPKGDPSVIEYYGGWSNFGSYLGYISLFLGIIGAIFAGKRYWVLLAIGVFGLIVSSSPFLTPALASFMPIPPQYFIIIATFILATFAAVGLNTLWRFLGKDPLTNIIIATIVFIALFDLLNVTSKTLQFSFL